MSIEILFEQETKRKVESLKETDLKSLSELCDKLLRVQGTIGNAEDRLQRLKETEKNLSEEVIPLRLQELGIQDIRLSDGSRISAEPYYCPTRKKVFILVHSRRSYANKLSRTTRCLTKQPENFFLSTRASELKLSNNK